MLNDLNLFALGTEHQATWRANFLKQEPQKHEQILSCEYTGEVWFGLSKEFINEYKIHFNKWFYL